MVTSVPNVLGSVRLRTKQEVSDAANLAGMILDPNGVGFDIWAGMGRDILVAVILHVLYVGDDKTIRAVARFFRGDDDLALSLGEHIDAMRHAKHDPNLQAGWHAPDGSATATHPVIERYAAEFLARPPMERSGIIALACLHLDPYRNRSVEFTPWSEGQ
jgi:type IV secretion system protein VirD4